MLHCSIIHRLRIKRKKIPIYNFILLQHTQTAISRGRTARCLGPRHGLVVLKHSFPVDLVPPSLQILLLAADAVVHQPHVLPSVDAQDGLDIERTECQVPRIRGVAAHRPRVLVAYRSVWVVGVHVDGLSPIVGGRIGRPGIVCADNLNQAISFQVLGQPDKSWTEHGVGRGEKVLLQGLDRGGAFVDIFDELVGNGDRVRRLQECFRQSTAIQLYLVDAHKAVEEKVVVVGH
jgi:hypothetical protein